MSKKKDNMTNTTTHTYPYPYTSLSPKQIAGRAFDEAKTEALLMTGAPGGGAVWEEEGQGADDGWDWFTMLGIERPKVCGWVGHPNRLLVMCTQT